MNNKTKNFCKSVIIETVFGLGLNAFTVSVNHIAQKCATTTAMKNKYTKIDNKDLYKYIDETECDSNK